MKSGFHPPRWGKHEYISRAEVLRPLAHGFVQFEKREADGDGLESDDDVVRSGPGRLLVKLVEEFQRPSGLEV